MRKALFLDRDGVINIDRGYVSRIEDIQFVDGIFALCRKAHERGYLLIVVTNQSGIGRGFYSEQDYVALMDWMHERFVEETAPWDAAYHCPHHPEQAQGEYLLDCQDRKPHPGMLLKAKERFGIDMARSIMIGDKPSDIEAGRAAGVGTLLYLNAQDAPGLKAPRLASLKEAEAWL